jgi:hypothetical protein
MRAKRHLRVLALLLAGLFLPVLTATAHHFPQVSDVTAQAAAQGMQCTPDVGQVYCSGFGPTETYRTALVKPASGPLDSLVTTAPAFQGRTGYYMDPNDQSWNTAMHNVGCDNAAAVAAFIAGVAALSVLDTSVAPSTLGECSMSGTLSSGSIDFSPMYVVTSRTLPSAFATPTPTPSPTPRPTASPRPTVAPTATPRVTATARPSASPTATATATSTATAAATSTATASESASGSASASESATASQTATAIPAATPEQSVEGITFTPEPSAPVGAPHGVGGWPGTVPGAGEVSTKPADLGGSALAAGLMLVVMGFIGELFNNTMETNYDRILAWWQKSWVGRLGRALGGPFGGGSA